MDNTDCFSRAQIPSRAKSDDDVAVLKKHETNIDLEAIVDQLCDLLLHDLVLPWYKDVSYEQATLTQAVK